MKPRMWKMYGVWWCGSYQANKDGRISDGNSVCAMCASEAYKRWKEQQ